MKILSLFDGISCARLALQRAGILVEVYYASEIEFKPIEISKKNYPDIIQLGDVTKITKDMVGEVDLICGGSPCQSFSNAGNRAGFNGKSGLFYEFVRLVKEIQPKYFLLENVKMKQEWQDVISSELGVKPIEINSNLVSGQNRKRLYWTNIPNVAQPEDKGIYLTDVLEEEVDERYYLNQKSLHIKSPTLVAAMGMGGGNVPVIIRNNSLSIKEKSNTIRTSGRGSGVDDKHNWDEIRLANNRIRKLTEIECERLQTLPDNYTQGVSSTARYKAIGNGWTVDVIAHILSFISPPCPVPKE